MVVSTLGSGVAQAAEFTVRNNADSGPGSLRQAVSDANAAGSGSHTITIAEGLGTITLTGAQIDITRKMTIVGPATGQTIDGDKANRFGRIFGVTETVAVTLENLTLTNAETTADREDLPRGYDCSDSTGWGGAVCAEGDLTLTNSTVSGNATQGRFAAGGGILSFGIITLTNSTPSGNFTQGELAQGGWRDNHV